MSYRLRRVSIHLPFALLFCWVFVASAGAQQRPGIGYQDPPRLKKLIDEAMTRNPSIIAARLHWQAQNKVPIQAATLPDPQLTLQPFSVGSPLPGAGLSTSDFAYTGFGISQSIPYPGKLRLTSRIAEDDAQVAAAQAEQVRREVRERIRELYFELFFHDKLFAVLNLTRENLDQVEQAAQSHYRVGHGSQHDVIAAQLKQTALLKDLAMHHQEEHQLNVELKAQLGRDLDSADIETGEVTPSHLELSSEALRQLVFANAPQLKSLRVAVQSGADQLELAREGYRPDFSLGYMYQKTGPGVRDYYMLSLGVTVPLYFWRKQTAAVQQASLQAQAARQQERWGELQAQSTAQSALISLRTADRMLKIYHQGLLPQGRTALESAFAAYQVGSADFQTLVSSLIDFYNLQQEYYRAVADHEIAAAKVEQFIEEGQ